MTDDIRNARIHASRTPPIGVKANLLELVHFFRSGCGRGEVRIGGLAHRNGDGKCRQMASMGECHLLPSGRHCIPAQGTISHLKFTSVPHWVKEKWTIYILVCKILSSCGDWWFFCEVDLRFGVQDIATPDDETQLTYIVVLHSSNWEAVASQAAFSIAYSDGFRVGMLPLHYGFFIWVHISHTSVLYWVKKKGTICILGCKILSSSGDW